jgi:hypothetical protein
MRSSWARLQNWEWSLLASSCRSVLPSIRPSVWNNFVPTGRIFMEFDIRVLENLSRKFKFHSDTTIIAGTLHKERYTFFIISRSVLRMRNVSGKWYRENQTIILFLKTSLKRILPFVRKWKNIVEPDRPWMTIMRMRIVCWITKYTDTHTEYVILTAFPLQQCLHERDSVLRLYEHCLSCWILNLLEHIVTTGFERINLCEGSVELVTMNSWRPHSVVLDEMFMDET